MSAPGRVEAVRSHLMEASWAYDAALRAYRSRPSAQTKRRLDSAVRRMTAAQHAWERVGGGTVPHRATAHGAARHRAPRSAAAERKRRSRQARSQDRRQDGRFR